MLRGVRTMLIETISTLSSPVNTDMNQLKVVSQGAQNSFIFFHTNKHILFLDIVRVIISR